MNRWRNMMFGGCLTRGEKVNDGKKEEAQKVTREKLGEDRVSAVLNTTLTVGLHSVGGVVWHLW
jgi:hypothetical protein